MNRNLNYADSAAIAEENARFMAKVYRWMSLGILITGMVSYGLAQDINLVYALMANRLLFWGLIITQLVLVFVLSGAIHKMRAMTASLIFLGYSALTAYDTQKIKQMNIIGNEGTEENSKEAIRGALTLYLDFINLFLFILRLSGGGRKR